MNADTERRLFADAIEADAQGATWCAIRQAHRELEAQQRGVPHGLRGDTQPHVPVAWTMNLTNSKLGRIRSGLSIHVLYAYDPERTSAKHIEFLDAQARYTTCGIDVERLTETWDGGDTHDEATCCRCLNIRAS